MVLYLIMNEIRELDDKIGIVEAMGEAIQKPRDYRHDWKGDKVGSLLGDKFWMDRPPAPSQ